MLDRELIKVIKYVKYFPRALLAPIKNWVKRMRTRLLLFIFFVRTCNAPGNYFLYFKINFGEMLYIPFKTHFCHAFKVTSSMLFVARYNVLREQRKIYSEVISLLFLFGKYLSSMQYKLLFLMKICMTCCVCCHRQ